MVVDTELDLAGGLLNLTLAGNYTDTKITDPGRYPHAHHHPGTRGCPAGHARHPHRRLQPGDWSGLVRANYYDSVQEQIFNDPEPSSGTIRTASLAVVDAELTWRVSQRYALTVGAKNLFDRQPDQHRFAGVSGYLGADYPLNHPAGFNGGSYYFRVDAEF